MFDDYFSQDLKEDEEVVVIFRKNWGSRIFNILKVVLFFAIPLFFSFWLLRSAIGGVVFLLLMLWAIGYTIYIWTNWYFDSVVITNQRVIKISQKGMFNKSVEEIPLDHIVNVSYEIPGFFATVFNYGTQIIELDIGKKMILECLSDPKKTQDLITELSRLASKKVSAEELVEFISRVKWDVFKKDGSVRKKEKLD